MVVIGFAPDDFFVDESAGIANFTIQVLSGMLSFDVVVAFSTRDGDALGKCMKILTNTVCTL